MQTKLANLIVGLKAGPELEALQNEEQNLPPSVSQPGLAPTGGWGNQTWGNASPRAGAGAGAGPTLFSPIARAKELNDELEDSLAELEEGLDVLQILEKAYEKTLKAHVAPVRKDPTPTPAPTPRWRPSCRPRRTSPPSPRPSSPRSRRPAAASAPTSASPSRRCSPRRARALRARHRARSPRSISRSA